MNSKKFISATFILTIMLLSLVALPIIKIDPFLHYHRPVENLEYQIDWDTQRYVNSGIIKHFDYDAIIIGSSMTENFRASDLNTLFGVNSIKVPFEAASFREISEFVNMAVEKNKNLKMVVRGLDFMGVVDHKDQMNYDESKYPRYLYNDNILDDIKYILNKEILFDKIPNRVLNYTKSGYKTPNFDEYCAWYEWSTFSKEVTLQTYTRPEQSIEIKTFDEKFKKQVYENTMQNLVEVAKNNPNIEFYYFYTPYSLLFFDMDLRNGELERTIDSAEYTTSLLLDCPNIKIFSCYDNHDMICNLDLYMDFMHHDEQVNSWILNWIHDETGLLTKDNYKQHFEDMRQFYLNYDYEAIFS